jgi:hypothetical protein
MAQLFFIPKAVRINSSGTPYAGAKAYFYLTGTTTATDTYQDSALGTAHANPVVADSAGQWAPIYLDPDITYRCIIKESDDTQIDDVDPVFTPAAAANITVTDTGAYFAGSDVETVLADIGANYAKVGSANTWTATQTFSGASLEMQDNAIVRAVMRDYAVLHNTITSSSNSVTADLSTGNSFYHLLTENTTFTLSNPPASPRYGICRIRIKQDGAGGAYTVAWPASVVWAGGSAPTISTGNNAIDIITLETDDGGTTWYGNYSQAFA